MDGDETITLNRVQNSGTYKYFVHDYSNNTTSSNLSNSRAHVQVLSRRVAKTVIETDTPGNCWEVFSIVMEKSFPMKLFAPWR